MADFRAFRGWRPPVDRAARVSAVPYDVVDTREARALAAGNPDSLLHVTRPDIDLPDDVSPHSERAYEQARVAFDRLLASGGLQRDVQPGFYAYAQTMGGHRQLGLLGLASADEYAAGVIKRHELTRADKEEDRVRHVRTLGAHMGPVFLTYRGVAAIDRRLDALCAVPPEVDFVAHDGVRHQVWPIFDPEATDALQAAFAEVPALYIADGHHRAAAAARVGLEAPPGDPARSFLACAFPADQLRILPYNRVVADLRGLSPSDLRARLSETFDLQPLPGPTEPGERHAFAMYLDGAWWRLTLLEPAAVDEEDPVGRLDVSLLQRTVLEPVLGIGDPRRDTRIDFVGGIRGLAELERRVDAGAGVAFALDPTSLADLMAIADAGAVMPPKSTWFEPKLRSGLVVNRFR